MEMITPRRILDQGFMDVIQGFQGGWTPYCPILLIFNAKTSCPLCGINACELGGMQCSQMFLEFR